MALFVRQNEDRSKLQERLAAELREKAKQQQGQGGAVPDGVNDSQYIKGTKQTTGLAFVWLLVFIVALVLFAVFISM